MTRKRGSAARRQQSSSAISEALAGPRARRDVVSEPLDSELLIYDAARHMAHCLPAEVARAWECCDGTRSTSEIAHVTGLEREIVDAAVAALADRGLLVSYSRREALGLVAAAAPLVYSVAVPTPAAAAGGAARRLCGGQLRRVPRQRRLLTHGAEQPVRLGLLLHVGHRPSLRVCAGVSGGRREGPELQQRRRPLLRRGVHRASIRM